MAQPVPRRQLRAKQICHRCPLVDACRRYSLTAFVRPTSPTKVVIAGMTEREVIWERTKLGLPSPQAPSPPSTSRPAPLAVRSSAEKDASIDRITLSRAHGYGQHENAPHAGCPRCT